MKIGDFVKSLVSLYITIWLLILKKIRDVYQLEGPHINFGVFLKLFLNSDKEPPKRSVSMPTIHRSISIRERRRNKSDPCMVQKTDNSFSTQNFLLRRKNSSTSLDNLDGNKSADFQIGKMKFKCRKSLIIAREEKTAKELNSKSDEISKVEEGTANSDSKPNRQQLMAQRAFTFPDLLKVQNSGRSRTTSERAEEGDQVMPLPVFPKNRRKSCIGLSASASASITSAASKGPTGPKPPKSCPSSPKSNNSRRIVVHHKKKSENNAWHNLQKLPKVQESKMKQYTYQQDFRPVVSKSVIVKVAHR